MKKSVHTTNTISERLRRLRLSLEPRPEQGDIAKAIGTTQAWVSRRETGEVEPTVSEAILLAETLGYSAELLILEKQHRELIGILGRLSATQASDALRLLVLWPHLDETALNVIDALLQTVEKKQTTEAARDSRQAL